MIIQVYESHPCGICGEPATRRLTFLLENCRANPASSAYHHDDCSWCVDAEDYSCEEHKQEAMTRLSPSGMDWCATYDLSKYPHMSGKWSKSEQHTKELEGLNPAAYKECVEALTSTIAHCELALAMMRDDVSADHVRAARNKARSVLVKAKQGGSNE